MCAKRKKNQQRKTIKTNEGRDVRRQKLAGTASACSKLLSPVLLHSNLGPLSCGNAARRRVWRMVGVGMRPYYLSSVNIIDIICMQLMSS